MAKAVCWGDGCLLFSSVCSFSNAISLVFDIDKMLCTLNLFWLE